jgi:23S rRNA A1618 N6-methylase RlmF
MRGYEERWKENGKLLPEIQGAENFEVTLGSGSLHEVEKTAALAHHLEKTGLCGEIFFVGLQVFGEKLDAVGQKSDLNFRKASVGRGTAVLGDDGGFSFFLGNRTYRQCRSP